LGAAEAYSVALQRLSAQFTQGWIATDWADGQLQWRLFRPDGERTPQHGWKVHVSASADECTDFLAAVAAVLHETRAAFKLPLRVEDIVLINSGDAGAMQIGKVVTIYPRDVDHARAVIQRLDAAWPESRGPEVQTDLHPRPGSAVAFRFGAFGTGDTIVNARGLREYAVELADGSAVADERRTDGVQPDGAPDAPIRGVPPRSFPVELNGVVHFGSREVVALAQLGDSPRARTFLCADLDSLETLVLKVGRPGVSGEARGPSVRQRFRREYQVLAALDGLGGAAPRAIELIDDEWPILVIGDVRGDCIASRPRHERIDRLPALARALARMHAAGYVHGDVKLDNIACRDDDVCLIDFELADQVGAGARPGGTRGHMPPEAQTRAPLHPSRDVFALAGCVAHAVLDVPPAILPAGVGRLRALLQNEGATCAAHLIAQFGQASAADRPSAEAAARSLASKTEELRAQLESGRSPRPAPERRWQRRACQDAARLARAYAVAGADGRHWRNDHFMRAFDCEGINLGAAGIVLGLLTVDTALGRSDFIDDVRGGARWLAMRPAADTAAGAFTGNAGVALALAVAGVRLREPALLDAARHRMQAAAGDGREIDLFSGSAGVIWSACLLSDVLRDRWPLDAAAPIVDDLQSRAREVRGLRVWSEAAATGTHLGCAHGTAGIAMALAHWGRRTGSARCVEDALDAFRSIHACGRTADGKAMRMDVDSTRHHNVGNWCHGVAGYLWCMLQSFGDEPRLRTEIDWAVDCIGSAPAAGTPTFCHGLAGQLELWHMVRSLPRHRDLADARAEKVARALRILHHKQDARCAWISDDPRVTTPDLWIGFLGPASALAMHVAGTDLPLLSSGWLSRCASPATP